MEIYEELRKILRGLEHERIPYALCGGLALAVYGIIRATQDIDLLIEEDSLEPIRAMTATLGFRLNPTPFIFKNGQVKIYRMFKPQGEEDVLVLDLLIVNKSTSAAWNSIRRIETDFGPVQVVSPAGLIHLKSLRRSGQDEDDILKLKEYES
jgi:hypothetical protein